VNTGTIAVPTRTVSVAIPAAEATENASGPFDSADQTSV
jgi:hypothetical protein